MAQNTLIVERDVEVPMRDGTILRADVYRPVGSERLPVLLQRTPYGKALTNTAFALTAAERGYVVIAQAEGSTCTVDESTKATTGFSILGASAADVINVIVGGQFKGQRR